MSFEVPADAYQRLMGVYSDMLAPVFADLAGVAAGDHVLDVGCGPGGLTAELVARVGAQQVAAVDPSESFVEATRRRLPEVDVRTGAAEALPHPDHRFDAALAQLVVHFMADPVAGLREMGRVTRTGGVVAVCVWALDGDRGPFGPFWRAVRELDPDAADESRLAGAREGHLAMLCAAAGLTEIESSTLTVRRTYQTFDEWWTPFTYGVALVGAYVAGLDDRRRTQLRDRCAEYLPTAPFEIAASAWAVRARAA